MSISIRDALYQKGDDFRGAIFLTYSLNLNFFEQLIMPQLNLAGCSHAIVIADVFGYDHALAQGSRTLTSVGRRYVCAPLVNPGSGVQHAKFVLLAGPRQGRLLAGSGNLTLAGYGRNMELFSRFDVKRDEGRSIPPEAAEPFVTTWELLQRLKQNDGMSTVAREQLDAIHEQAPWLNTILTSGIDTTLWHSLVRSIYSRLQELDPVQELQIIAPFQDLDTIQALVRHFRPKRLVVGVDSTVPNLDGAALARQCAGWDCSLELRALGGREGHRMLHAKAIIGIHESGAWCVTGSANCTPSAMLRTWQSGGNLELVTWQTSDDPAAYEALWQDQLVMVAVREPFDIQAAAEPPSDEPSLPAVPSLRLLELSCEGLALTGRLDRSKMDSEPCRWELQFLRGRQSLCIHPNRSGRFNLYLEAPLQGAEAGRVLIGFDSGEVLVSPYHWIDQPPELARYGRRTYYARVRESLNTFDGAGKLFEELMNYLWERVDPRAIHDQQRDHSAFVRRGQRNRSQDDDTLDEVPPPESFITQEQLVNTLGDWVEYDLPFDRSTMSLRDLLSLALLRLTTETVLPPTDVGDDRERNEEVDTQRAAEAERQQRSALEQLRAYLLGYCNRYARRMTDPAFVVQNGPRLLFENHHTLGRALLEVADKVDVFTKHDLRRTAFQLLGGMFWPEGIQLSGPGAWTEVANAGHEVEDLRKLWDGNELTPLTMTLFLEGWSDPMPWSVGLYDKRQTQLSLRTKKLIELMELALGPRFWEPWKRHSMKQHDVWGFRTLAALEDTSDVVYQFAPAGDRCARLVGYLTPAVEKYRDLWRLQRLIQGGQGTSSEAARLARQIEDQGYAQELELFRALPNSSRLRPMQGNSSHCPGCFITLPTRIKNVIREGQLVLCPNCQRTVIYWEPLLDLSQDVL